MLLLIGLLAAIFLGWVLLGPLILPPPAEAAASGPGFDGEWTLTALDPLATTFVARSVAPRGPEAGTGAVEDEGHADGGQRQPG